VLKKLLFFGGSEIGGKGKTNAIAEENRRESAAVQIARRKIW